ncbi:hypothetical protein HOL24_00200, partial [bacterium]|nr:hypothetical protein [bacterium]
MKNILVFIDSYNDVDHILPILHYLYRYKDVNISIMNTSVLGVEEYSDKIKYIQNELHIDISQFYDHLNYYAIVVRNYNKLQKRVYMHKDKALFLPLIAFLSWTWPLVLFFLKLSMKNFFQSLNPDIIMLDLGKERRIPGRAVVNLANDTGIPVIGYAHGYFLYTNTEPFVKNKVKLSLPKKLLKRITHLRRKTVYCDRYIVGMNQKKTLFKSSAMSGYNEKLLNRVNEIGLPRFTKEWTNIYRKKIDSSKFTYGQSEKINVVFFLSAFKYNVLVEELITTMKLLANNDDINFVFKPHTRIGFVYDGDPRELGYNAEEVSSIALSKWSDVAIVYGSSIGFQSLLDNVPVVMPQYLHRNTTIYEENDVCITVQSYKELSNVLDKKILSNDSCK